MASTIKVNGMFNSLVHKSSSGVVMSTVPDVCKTPSPGGPVPIPYPVIVSMSTNLVKGTKTVKVDGKKMAAVKGSEFSRCMGDEPGVTGGVVSNTNMKEAGWILYSFDVKMDGKNCCRLMDKMTMNHKNTVSLCGELQPPVVGIDMSKIGTDQDDACAKIEDKKVDDTPEAHAAAAKRAGMREDDYQKLRSYAGGKDVAVSFRQTNPAGIGDLGKLPSKPMTCKQGTDAVTGRTKGHPVYTGDYDMHDLIDLGSGSTIRDPGRQQELIKGMNRRFQNGKSCPRIMHGPQATFGDWIRNNPNELRKWQAKKPFGEYPSLAEKMKKYLKPGATPLEPVTMFDGSTKPATVYQLEGPEDVLNFYKCKGADPPADWQFEPKPAT